MNFPKKLVAAHSARKPGRTPILRPEIIPLKQVPTTDLKLLGGLSAAPVRRTNKPLKPGAPR